MTKNIGNQGIRGLKSAGAWRGTYHPSYRPTKKVTRTDLARRKWLHKAKKYPEALLYVLIFPMVYEDDKV